MPCLGNAGSSDSGSRKAQRRRDGHSNRMQSSARCKSAGAAGTDLVYLVHPPFIDICMLGMSADGCEYFRSRALDRHLIPDQMCQHACSRPSSCVAPSSNNLGLLSWLGLLSLTLAQMHRFALSQLFNSRGILGQGRSHSQVYAWKALIQGKILVVLVTCSF